MLSTRQNYVLVWILIKLIILQLGEAVSTSWNLTTTYPYADHYHIKLTEYEIKCKNFNCEKSGLSHATIQLLLGEMNDRLSLYTEGRRTSNTYRLFWDEQIAIYAKEKVKLCLPATVAVGNPNTTVLYDTKGFFEFGSHSPILDLEVAMEVVIGSRQKNKLGVSDEISFIAAMHEEYTDLFFHNVEASARKGGATLVGCGYIFEELPALIRDHLLCIFAYIYFGRNAFVAKHGIPCSSCDYYDNKNTFPDHYLVNPETPMKWTCNSEFPNLCSDTNRISHIVKSDWTIKYDCLKHYVDTPNELPPINPAIKMREEYKESPTRWPCYYIAVPILMTIVVVLLISAYHFTMAYIIKKHLSSYYVRTSNT